MGFDLKEPFGHERCHQLCSQVIYYKFHILSTAVSFKLMLDLAVFTMLL